MEKTFGSTFDALEIEAHEIVQWDNGTPEGQIVYEPVGVKDGVTADVWSLFGHIPAKASAFDNVQPADGGRRFICDCESAEAAAFMAGLVRENIQRTEYALHGHSPEVEIYWYTDRPESKS